MLFRRRQGGGGGGNDDDDDDDDDDDVFSEDVPGRVERSKTSGKRHDASNSVRDRCCCPPPVSSSFSATSRRVVVVKKVVKVVIAFWRFTSYNSLLFFLRVSHLYIFFCSSSCLNFV